MSEIVREPFAFAPSRPLREDERWLQLTQIARRLELGKRTCVRIIIAEREKWTGHLTDRLDEAIAGGPSTIYAEMTIPRLELRAPVAALGREFQRLFDFGEEQVDGEMKRQNSLSLGENRTKREIKELFLARARGMMYRVTDNVERSARDYAETMWRTLGVHGITTEEIDHLTQQIVNVVDKEGKIVAAKNVTESFNLGRHHAAMRLHLEGGVDTATYSAVLDTNTCDVCSSVDGRVVRIDTADYYRLMPPNRRCAGGSSCRCVWTYQRSGSVVELPTEDLPG